MMLEACQHFSYATKFFHFQFRTQESLESIKPQKKHLETMFHGTSTRSKILHNLLASHVNGRINPIHSLAICAKWLHFMRSLPQRWNHHQRIVLVKPSMVRFKKRKTTTNNGNRILLSYPTTICITFYPSNKYLQGECTL